ncbi:hypothetical protein [Natronolimnohabitans innermongolicus]|uniref:DUF2800 domain-containing protein n=1 Tax=Natronolimnohabitans innermongolicus JCM 12255 TaxID=1227499 RepID=L9X7F7_9EURY|nr:hypothetical protein [Natronolimnohabitans innermongolicus]ELY57714.1 hypothetical protein C493_07479 [Natronolimnohabitans innermongolicus JCM 12255]
MNDEHWADLREQCEALEPGAQLLTPVSDRPFRIGATASDRIVVRFADSDEERPLWREQFGVFDEQLEGQAMAIGDLQPGVEPYATVLTLTDAYAVEDDAIVATDDATGGDGESSFLVPAADARTPPERVHDDALLLAHLVEHLEIDDHRDLESLDTGSLTDYYVLASDVQRGADGLRSTARDELLERLGPDQQLHGRFGTVRRTVRERRRPKDDETILAALDERGIPREWVLGVDTDKLDVVCSVTDLEEDAVYDVDESVYVQKTDVDEDEKFERLRGLADRLDALEDADGEALAEELEAIEDRLEEALTAG